MSEDLNGDGVSLLIAYALNLNPHQWLSEHALQTSFPENQMEVTFIGSRSDLTYMAETSTDLVNWTTGGVTLSQSDLEGNRMASIPRSESTDFVRLIVEAQ